MIFRLTAYPESKHALVLALCIRYGSNKSFEHMTDLVTLQFMGENCEKHF